MAEAYGKLTGRPGIAFVTRGPGASNAAIGLHTAAQDSTPMILFVGQVGSEFTDREAFQEIDYRRMYGSIAKWVAQIDRAERIPEYVARAFRIAHVRPSGTRRAGAARRHADRDARPSTTHRASNASPLHPAPERNGRSCARASRRRSGRSSLVGGSGWNADACARSRPVRATRTRCRSRVRFAARISSTTAIRSTPAMSASASIRSSRRACATPTCCSSSASGWAK